MTGEECLANQSNQSKLTTSGKILTTVRNLAFYLYEYVFYTEEEQAEFKKQKEEYFKKLKTVKSYIVEFITGLVKGALDNLNLKAHCTGEWKEDTRMLEISIEIM